jgi:hypothetical protein
VAVGLLFRPHYFLQIVPALAAAAGLALAGLARRALAAPAPLRAGLGVAGLAAVVLLLPVWSQRAALFAGSPAARSRAIYGFNPFPESSEIARYIQRTSDPGDAVYVVGSEPQIFFHAERRSATRYMYFYPLTGDEPGALERQREAMAQVHARRPRYVVWVNVATSLLVSARTEGWIFEESDALLRRDYGVELVARVDAARASYELVHGREAERWLRAERAAPSGLPWVALFRRAR